MILTSCTDIALVNPGEESPLTGASLTVYLDNNVPPASQQSRALNLNLARTRYDFLEVIFMFQGGIARASWEVGQTTGISGVLRGVDYRSVNPTAVGSGTGAAVIFLGSNSDKTLFAIGKISHVDDVDITTLGGAAVITDDSRSVTFTVSALTADVTSSFLLEGGVVDEIKIGPYYFPWYVLETGNSSISASYTFGLQGANFGDYLTAIRQVGNPGINIIRSVPTYTNINGIVYHTNPGELDVKTELNISSTYNTASNAAFQNPVLFTLDTTKTDTDVTTLFSFVFSVPVNALSTGGDDPITWYIRPGYGQYLRDLDTGTDGGGGILLGADIGDGS